MTCPSGSRPRTGSSTIFWSLHGRPSPRREQRARDRGVGGGAAPGRRGQSRRVSRVRQSRRAVAQGLYGRHHPRRVAMGERLRSLESNRSVLIVSPPTRIQPFPRQSSRLFPRAFAGGRQSDVPVTITGWNWCCAPAGRHLWAHRLGRRDPAPGIQDNRLRTRADVRRVTGLPVLAALGDVKRLSPADARPVRIPRLDRAAEPAAFRSPRGMVCGISSAIRATGAHLGGPAGPGGVPVRFRVLAINTSRRLAGRPRCRCTPSPRPQIPPMKSRYRRVSCLRPGRLPSG